MFMARGLVDATSVEIMGVIGEFAGCCCAAKLQAAASVFRVPMAPFAFKERLAPEKAEAVARFC